MEDKINVQPESGKPLHRGSSSGLFLAYEVFFLIFFGLVLLVWFEDTTMFHIEWPARFIKLLRWYAAAVFLGRIFIERTWKRREAVLALLVCGSLFLTWYRSGIESYDQIMILAVLIIGAKGIRFDHIAKVYLAVCTPFLIFTVICSLTGNVENLVYHLASHGYKTRISFGFIYPTDFCAHLLFMTLCYVWLRDIFLKYVEIIAIAAVGAFCYVFCDTRTTTLLFWILALILLGGKVVRDKKDQTAGREYLDRESLTSHRDDAVHKILAMFCSMLPVVLAAVMVLLSRYYNPDTGWMSRLNSILNNRLYYGKVGFDRYNVHTFGQYVEMHGMGGSTVKPAEYFFLDSSYVNILLRYGWAVLLGVLITLVIIIYRSCAARKWIHVLVLLLIILDCAIEHHMMEFYYNPFLMLLFAVEGSYGEDV